MSETKPVLEARFMDKQTGWWLSWRGGAHGAIYFRKGRKLLYISDPTWFKSFDEAKAAGVASGFSVVKGCRVFRSRKAEGVV